jgi:hypothetical protein
MQLCIFLPCFLRAIGTGCYVSKCTDPLKTSPLRVLEENVEISMFRYPLERWTMMNINSFAVDL